VKAEGNIRDLLLPRGVNVSDGHTDGN